MSSQGVDEYIQLPVSDPSDQEQTSCCQAVESCTEKTQKKFDLTIDLVQITVACVFPCSDFILDTGNALPTFYAKPDKTEFWLQLAIIVFAAVAGSISWIIDENIFAKIRINEGFRPAIILGIILVFPLFPFSVIVAAVFAWIAGNKEAMNNCKSSVVAVASSEVIEALLSLTLQSNGYFFDGTDGIELSILVSWICAAKVACEHNFSAVGYWGCTIVADSPNELDEHVPIILGPLQGPLTSPWRSVLVFTHSLCEVASGVGCIILFQNFAHDAFILDAIQLGSFSVAFAVLYVVQVVMYACIFRQVAPVVGQKAFEAVLKAPFFIPLSLLDGSINVLPLFLGKMFVQMCMLVFVIFSQGGDRLDQRIEILAIGFAVTCVVSWLSFLLLRLCALTEADAQHGICSKEQIKIANAIRKGTCRMAATNEAVLRHSRFEFFSGICTEALVDVKADEKCIRGLATLGLVVRSLTVADHVNMPMDNVTFPQVLESLTFGEFFDQTMDKVTLPTGLQSLTFGAWFNQTMDKVTLPTGLQSLTFGRAFNQTMDKVTLPIGCLVRRS